MDHPLDRWSRRVIKALARELGGKALFPFDGPPFLPFQRWAQQAESVYSSPIGLLIHPYYGLWHSYRGAIGLCEALVVPEPVAVPSPCESCAGRWCLKACPVGAFSDASYDVAACAGYLKSAAGADCMATGCQARRACPVGAEHAYGPNRRSFFMAAFLRGQGALRNPRVSALRERAAAISCEKTEIMLRGLCCDRIRTCEPRCRRQARAWSAVDQTRESQKFYVTAKVGSEGKSIHRPHLRVVRACACGAPRDEAVGS